MRNGRPIRVVLADDHTLFRQGLRTLLERFDHFQVVGEARDGEEAVLVARQTRPDVLLLDLRMPIMDGICVTRILAGKIRPLKILILSSFEDASLVAAAMRAGAAGFVAKRVDIDELVEIVKETVSGRTPLSPFLANLTAGEGQTSSMASAEVGNNCLTARERELLNLLAQGCTNGEIARTICMSSETVKARLKALFGKLQVRNRTQAAVVAVQCGMFGSSKRTVRRAQDRAAPGRFVGH